MRRFPGYFLKEKWVGVDDATARSICNPFREHLAPALGITHRFVARTVLSFRTCAYNPTNARIILHDPKRSGPVIEVVELARVEKNGAAISASRQKTVYRT